MKEKKLCVIYNTAPLYREAIFRKIDEEYDCDWYFGSINADIKQMDTSILKNVGQIEPVLYKGQIVWKRGLLELLFQKKYKAYLMLFETRSLADWIFVLIAAFFFKRKRIYIWGHGWYGKESKKESKMKHWLYRHVTGTFVYGNFAKKLMVEQGLDEKSIFVIHNSLHYDDQFAIRQSIKPSNVYSNHFGNDHPVILFIGRMTKVKQLDLLVDAIALLKKKGERYNLVFVGDGEEKENLDKQVIELGIKDVVWFYGACYDEKENASLIYNADLCVAPGNVGLTAMHTMVFGTPVISHNDYKWQMPEFEAIRPGETGYFFERNNLNSLVDVISAWFKKYKEEREIIRKSCFLEIDTQWNPQYQINVIKKNLIV